MTHRPLDPRICNIGLDASALDLDGTTKDGLTGRFRELIATGALNVVVAGGVRGEVQHPKTPDHVKDGVLPRIFNLRPGLNPAQQSDRRRVAAILQGNAKPETHAADASHPSEAAETGRGYFITHDKRILSRRGELAGALPPSLTSSRWGSFLKSWMITWRDGGHEPDPGRVAGYRVGPHGSPAGGRIGSFCVFLLPRGGAAR
jgi:hypothetical protein